MTRFAITFDADLTDEKNRYAKEEACGDFGEALAAGRIPNGATIYVELSSGDVVWGTLTAAYIVTRWTVFEPAPGDRVYHRGRRESGTFVKLDQDTPMKAGAWVEFDGGDTAMVSTCLLNTVCCHCGDHAELGDDPAPGLCVMCAKAGRM